MAQSTRTRTAPQVRRLARPLSNPPRPPYPVRGIVCARHELPIHFRPVDQQFFCPSCEARRFLKALAAAGKAVAS